MLNFAIGTFGFGWYNDNEIAKAVKLADIAHNADQTRLGGCQTISEEKRLRLKQKYEKAKAILTDRHCGNQHKHIQK